MTTNLELIRKAVRQQTNLVDQPVRNLLGPVAASTVGVTTVQLANWLVLSVSGTTYLSDTQFYAQFAGDPTRSFQEVQAVNGALDLSIAPGRVILIRSVLDLPGDTNIPATLSTGSAQAEFGVYIDGTLMYKGSGKRSFSLQLGAGKHNFEIVVAATSFQLQLPSTLALSTIQDVLVAPTWFAVTTGYIDPSSGNTGTLLQWYNDTRVGGWTILRKETTALGQIVGLGSAIDSNGDFAVVLDGDHQASLSPGTSVFSGLEEMGTAMDALYDSAATITYNSILFTGITHVRVRLTSTRTGINTLWLGRLSGVADIREVQRVARTGGGTLVSWSDAAVVAGAVYEYTLQSYGLFNPGLLGPLAPWFFVRAGDTQPPASIVFDALYPRVINGRASVLYHTPSDQDYKGVRVAERSILQTGTSAGETSIGFSNVTIASPTQITTASVHGLTTGDPVYILGQTGTTPDINGAHIATVIDTTNFTIPIDVTVDSGNNDGTVVPNDTFILSAAPTSNPFGYTIEITNAPGLGQTRVVTSSAVSANLTIDLADPWHIAPVSTNTYRLYLDLNRLSDLGVPNNDDQLTFDVLRTIGASNIAERTDGSGTPGSPDTFSSATGGFTGAVFPGNLLELRTGSDIGFYIIDVITSDTALEISPVASGSGLSAPEASLTFEIFGQPNDPAYGEYLFLTFDHHGNEQEPIDALVWTYTAADDTLLGGGNQAPTVTLRQLNIAEQTALVTTVAGLTITGPPTTVTSSGNHGLHIGSIVTISGQTGTTQNINQAWYVLSVPTAITFTIAANVTSDTGQNDGTISPDYVDTVKYAVVEVAANDPEDGTAGVLINYRDRTRETGDAAASTSTTLVDGSIPAKVWNIVSADQWKNYLVEITGGPAVGQQRLITGNTATTLTVTPVWNTTPGASDTYSIHWVQVPATTSNTQVDDPQGVRGRLVSIARQQNQNWLQVQSEDAQGAPSNLFTYTPDFDRLPELTFIHRIDPVADEASIFGTLDDDANSFEWWVTAPTGNTIRAGDPTVNNKASITNVELQGAKSFGNTTVTEVRLGLPDGEQRDIHLQPATGGALATTITSSSVANPTTITTVGEHGIQQGATITIAGHTGSTPTTVNGSHVATVVTTTTFTIPINVTVGGTGGTVNAPGITGIEYIRTLTRAPRTVVTLNNRDEAGNVSNTRVQITFTTRPAIPIEATTSAVTTAESIRIAQRTDGVTNTGVASVALTSSSIANPSIITTGSNHNLATGDVVILSGHSGSVPNINKAYIATFVSATTFSIPENVTTGGSGGTVTAPDMLTSATGGFSGVVVAGDYVDIRGAVADTEVYLVTGVASDTVLGIKAIGGGSAVTGLSTLTFAVINPFIIIDSTDPTAKWTAGEFNYDPLVYNTYYAVWEPSDGSPFQIRQILTNTTTTLSVTPAWAPTSGAAHVTNGVNFPLASDVYRIKLGAALRSFGGAGQPGPGLVFDPVIERTSGAQPQIYIDRTTADIVLSYYSEITGNEAEKIQELTIDVDSIPEAAGLGAIEDPANVLAITIEGPDDDTKVWKCYAKKSTAGQTITSNTLANPTVVNVTGHGYVAGEVVGISNAESASTPSVPSINGEYVVSNILTNSFTIPVNVTTAGTSGPTVSAVAWPTSDSTRTGPLDPTYLRFQGTIDEPTITMQAGSGEWYIIGVPVGSFNDVGPWVFPDSDTGLPSPVHVAATASTTPTLSNILVTRVINSGEVYHHHTWTHGSTFDADAGYQVKIFGYRSDRGIGTEEELTGNGQAYHPTPAGIVGERRVYYETTAVPDADLRNATADAAEPTTSAVGSFQHWAGPDGTSISLTWKYRLEIWDAPTATTKIREYTIDKTNSYALIPPTNFRITNIQIIPYGGKNYAHVTVSWNAGDTGAVTQIWERKNTNNVSGATLIATKSAGETSHTMVRLEDGPPAINTYYNWVRHKSGIAFSTYEGDGNTPTNTNGLPVEYNDTFA